MKDSGLSPLIVYGVACLLYDVATFDSMTRFGCFSVADSFKSELGLILLDLD